ncbi:hypothetical protein K450DRAFT_226820 [Umbelopsis ramanniana AG]|uniref:Uncharacterized protein n=1 Tax=Umbelopsis ramanniana AG TaxID=1314678 RepID=A0AAD5HHJ5_UMBRA|nr:uncharacterized protein K450DRAFT_226820 [Umbelopsis ramanniana AG]KAI8582766.1 hypothetical protein K450DRAFT_226820 [Umbelopsis ramanniana AG]
MQGQARFIRFPVARRQKWHSSQQGFLHWAVALLAVGSSQRSMKKSKCITVEFFSFWREMHLKSYTIIWKTMGTKGRKLRSKKYSDKSERDSKKEKSDPSV